MQEDERQGALAAEDGILHGSPIGKLQALRHDRCVISRVRPCFVETC